MTHTQQIFRKMQDGRWITPREAERLVGTTRLSARIDDIENGKGVPAHKVRRERVKVPARGGRLANVARYKLDREKVPNTHFIESTRGFFMFAPCGVQDIRMERFTSVVGDVTCPCCCAALAARQEAAHATA